MNNLRQAVSEYCAQLGNDPDYIQGAGGNVSWKEEATLWVKASGAWLADALTSDIFVDVDLPAYKSKINEGSFGISPPLLSAAGGRRASIETLFHAVFPHKIVVHTHLIDALYYLVKDDAQSQLMAMSRTGLTWALVDYAKPGADLGESIWRVVNDRKLDVVFMANHGVIVGGDSIAEVKEKYDLLRKALGAKIPKLERLSPSPSAWQEIRALGYELLPGKAFHLLGRDEKFYRRLETDWALYPDHVVFLGPRANKSDDVNAALLMPQEKPSFDYLIIEGQGVLTRVGIESNKLEMLELYVRMLAMTEADKNIKTLSQREVQALLNWDAEKYRQALAK